MDEISAIRTRKMEMQILKRDEIREAKEEARRLKRIQLGSKPKPEISSEDLGGYVDNDRTYKVSGITEPSGFLREFKRIVSKVHPKARFISSKNIVRETTVAAEILDVLLEHNCRDRDVIKTWIEWFSTKKLCSDRLDKYCVSIKELKASWKDFEKVRVSEPKTKPDPVQKKHQKDDIIGDRMSEILSQGFSSESIMRICQIFGIVLTANYIRKFVKPDSEVVSLIKKILTDEKDERKLKSTISSTARYDIEFDEKNILLSDWRDWIESITDMIPPPRQSSGQETIVKLFLDNLEES